MKKTKVVVKRKVRKKQHDLRGAALDRLGDYCAEKSRLGGNPPTWDALAKMFHTAGPIESKLR